jgi:hypothetical protein
VTTLRDIAAATFQAGVDAATWLVMGLVIAGLVHEFVPPARLQRWLGRSGFGPLLAATGIGALLPMCSCGVVPTGIGLYRTGASLGATLAFMMATPVINPAAVVLCLALLGPRLTIVYAITALVGSVTLGWVGNRFFGSSPSRSPSPAPSLSPSPSAAPPPAPSPAAPPPMVVLVADEAPAWWRRVGAALRWGVWDLGTDVGYYILIGLVAAGVVGTLVPADVVSLVLGRGAFLSLLAALVIALPSYVCAVGSIPLVATLLVKGAAPGAAIVFLMAGPASNLGELLAIAARMGKRTAALFAGGVSAASVAGGIAANAWLGGLPYEVVTGGGGALKAAALAVGPAAARFSCPPPLYPPVALLFLLGVVGVWRRVRRLVKRGGRPGAAPVGVAVARPPASEPTPGGATPH